MQPSSSWSLSYVVSKAPDCRSIDSIYSLPPSTSSTSSTTTTHGVLTAAMCGSALGGNTWNGFISCLQLDPDTPSTRPAVLDSSTKVVNTGCSRIIPYDNHYYVAKDDGNIGVYDHLLSEVDTIDGHDDIVSCMPIDSPYSSLSSLVIAGYDSSIIRWDVATSSLLPDSHYGHVNDVSTPVSPSAPIIASTGHDGFLRIWDRRQGANVADIVNLDQIGPSLPYSGCEHMRVR
jgi:hypothetical protein